MADVPSILLVDDNVELVALLAQLFEEAGYRVRSFHRGRPALESIAADPPALGVLDLLLPDILGYEIGKELGARSIPFVFITGVFKGSRHALEAVRKHGCAGYFEKPFDTDKLLEAVRRLAPPPRQSEKAVGLEVELDIDVDEPDPIDGPLELTGKIAVSGERVSAVLTGSDLALKPADPTSTWVRQAPPPPRLTPAVPAARPPGATPGPGFTPGPALTPGPHPSPGPRTVPERVSADGRIRRGQLRDNLPQLITAFWQARGAGELGLQRGKVKKVLYFHEGRPVFALSNLAADRFGTFLCRVGKIAEPQLREAASRAQAEHRRTGDVLIEMGLLKDAERMYYVAQQVKAIIYSCFAWEDGEYVLSFQDRARHEPIQLGVHPAHLISRGIKKLYRKERLERLIALEDRPVPAADPVFQLTELELEPWEAQLLSRITGERTVAELIALAGKPTHMVYATLAALLGVNVIELGPA
jgi:two-component system OmpR family response regulator